MDINNQVLCKECNSNARCMGGKMILPKNGYMLLSFDNDEVLYCKNRVVNCLGLEYQPSYTYSTIYEWYEDLNKDPKKLTKKQCAEGYIGPLCEVCD
jgi:hypothetical protein